MKLLIDNKLKTASTVTVRSVNPSYPIVNLFDGVLKKQYRTLATNEQNITMINGSPTAIDTILIYGHNITDSATVKLKGSNSLNFDSPDYEIDLEVKESICLNITEESYSGWRVEIDDPTNTDNYIRIQEMFMGSCQEFAHFNIGYSVSRKPLSITSTTRGGVKYGIKQGFLESWDLSFSALDLTEKETVESIFIDVDITTPFWFVPFENEPSFLFVTLPLLPAITNDKYCYSMKVKLEEQK